MSTTPSETEQSKDTVSNTSVSHTEPAPAPVTGGSAAHIENIEEEVACLLFNIREQYRAATVVQGSTSQPDSPKRRKLESGSPSSPPTAKKQAQQPTQQQTLPQEEQKEPWFKKGLKEIKESDTEEDDDWKDKTVPVGATPAAATIPGPATAAVVPRVPRKKAPSGSACDKHKRWKKRCPEDCPMRKKIMKKSKSEGESESVVVDTVEESPKPAKKRSVEVTDGSATESPQTSRRGKRCSNGTVACEKHTQAHMRCPVTCPDRRLSKAKRSKDDNSEDLSPSSNIDDFSPKSFESYEEMEEQTENERADEADSAAKLLLAVKPSQSKEHKEKEPKQDKEKKPPKEKKGPRKYLPQACERHKLLHAKCPATCLDRIKRDAEKGIVLVVQQPPPQAPQTQAQSQTQN